MLDMDELSKIIEGLEAHAALVEQEKAKADALFLSIGDGAIATDEHGKITRVNKAALDILGFKRQELAGKWFPKVIVSQDETGKKVPPINRYITRAFITGKTVSGKTYYVKGDGSSIPVWVTVSPILLNEKPVGAIEVFRDITLEHEIDKMKSEFISIASHQLRTPLTAVKTYAYMLYDGYVGELTEEQKDFMRIVLSSVFRMNGLISTLLNVTRIEAGSIAVLPKPTDLEKLARDVIYELTPRAQEKQITIQFKANDTTASVKTDRLLTREVVSNLITNAIKYTPSGGLIKVKLYEEDYDVIFAVKDNGYGIPKAEQDRVFSKFFRANNVLKRETVGTGLGLYLVKGIVENLGGKIWFKSQEGEGSTFYFSLPKRGVKRSEGKTRLESTESSEETVPAER